MRLRVRTASNKLISLTDRPVSVEVLDAQSAIVAVVIQENDDTVLVLTPGDPQFEAYVLMRSSAKSINSIYHKSDSGFQMSKTAIKP